MIEWLAGKKTYLLALAGVIILVVRNGFGIEIPYVPLDPDWVVHVMGFMGLGTTRSAIAKAGE